MNVMRQFLACSTAFAVAATIPVVAHADQPGPAPRTGVASAPTTGPKNKLVFDGTRATPKRNNEMNAGAAPIWIQFPVLEKRKGKYSVRASALVRPHKRQSVHAKSAKDKITIKVAVFPRGKSVDESQASYVKRTSIKVTKRGVAELRVPVSKKAAKQVKTLEQQRDRIIVTLIHAKDTYPKIGTGADFQQVLSGAMTKRVLTNKQAQQRIKQATRMQRRVERGKSSAPKSAGARLSNLSEYYYTDLYVYNQTPFQQAVTLNPDIACMQSPGGGWVVSSVTVNPMIGTVQLISGYPTSINFDPESGMQWYGLNSGNPPSNVSDINTQLINAGRSSLNQLDSIMSDPETYTETGLITGVLSLGIGFAAKALAASIADNNQCASFGQFWGLTSTAVQIGTDGKTIVGNPDTWSLGYFQTPGDPQTQSNGQPIERYTEVGNQAQVAPNNLPTDPTDQANLAALMQQAVGQQTQVTYFNFGGGPTPVANANGNSAWNGSANYAQGLIQFVWPNPAACAYNNCNEATTGVQLAWLTSNFEAAPGPYFQTDQYPTATSTTDSLGNVKLTCDIPYQALFVNPFGGNQGQPAAAESMGLASAVSEPGVAQAGYSITYYAQDAKGNYLYDSESTSQSSFPAQTGSAPPTIDADTGGWQYLSASASTVSPTALTLSPSDIGRLINPQTGAQGVPATYGCSVTPYIQFSNANIASSNSVWGGNWPFPQVQSGGPLSPIFPNAVNWWGPTNAMNLTWTGPTYNVPVS